MKKSAMFVLLALGLSTVWSVASVEPAQAANRTEVRQQIRSMPLTQRPNRPGHIYGNNVRRIHHLRNS
jgi:hypothetical protein